MTLPHVGHQIWDSDGYAPYDMFSWFIFLSEVMDNQIIILYL